MHGFVRDVEQKRFRVLLFQEIDRVFVQDVGEIAAFDFASAIHVELRVEVAALALDAHPMVNARARLVVEAHVPFAEKCRLVARVVQQTRESDEFVTARAAIGVVGDPVCVRILASQKTRAARRAERRGDERVSKAHPLARDALDVRNFDERIIHFVPAQIVNEDEDDVRADS